MPEGVPSEPPTSHDINLPPLTKQERTLLIDAAKGLTTIEIVNDMKITEDDVTSLSSTTRAKLSAETLANGVFIAIETNRLDLDDIVRPDRRKVSAVEKLDSQERRYLSYYIDSLGLAPEKELIVGLGISLEELNAMKRRISAKLGTRGKTHAALLYLQGVSMGIIPDELSS